MKKRLLFALMAMCVAVSGFALEVGEYVYTPQGRFLITSQNVASSNFADFTGWTVVSATAEKTFDQAFNINANGYAEGVNSASVLTMVWLVKVFPLRLHQAMLVRLMWLAIS